MNSLKHGFDGDQPGNIVIDVAVGEDTIELDYRDDGKGLSDEVRNRVFEPFFTTARGSGGSGLGMHIVYNLVCHKLAGRIECLKTDKGAHFRLCLARYLKDNETAG